MRLNTYDQLTCYSGDSWQIQSSADKSQVTYYITKRATMDPFSFYANFPESNDHVFLNIWDGNAAFYK